MNASSMIMVIFTVLKTLTRFSSAIHFTVDQLENVSLENATRITKARSQTECVLRCERKKEGQQKMAFYSNEKECYCIISPDFTSSGREVEGKAFYKVNIILIYLPSKIYGLLISIYQTHFCQFLEIVFVQFFNNLQRVKRCQVSQTKNLRMQLKVIPSYFLIF